MDNFSCVFLVFCLARESKCVLWLAIGDLVDPTGRVSGLLCLTRPPTNLNHSFVARMRPGRWRSTSSMSFSLDARGVVDVDDNDFPVGLALVEQGHDSEDLDLFHLSGVTDLLADFADIQGIIVALGFSLDVSLTRVLPRLCATVSPSKRRECHFYNTPGGKRRSSRCIRGGESSCAQSATYLS